MKKIYLLALVFVCSSLLAFAQQDAQYTNFLFNSFAINPANAGLKECLDARLGYRVQWVGFEDNPKTVFASAHQRIKAISRPNGIIHGAGLSIEADNTGPTARTFVYGSYAVHLKMTRAVRLSLGVHIGFLQYRLDATKIITKIPDPVIEGSTSEIIFPDITPGVWLYSKDWFIGLSARHAANNPIENIGIDSQIKPHFSLMAGKILGNREGITFIPAGLLKFTGNSKPALDVNFWVDFENKLALGLAFRNDDAVAGMLKFNFLRYFTLAYAYDFTFSKIRYGSSNTHEITIGISACPRNQKQGFVPCAAYD